MQGSSIPTRNRKLHNRLALMLLFALRRCLILRGVDITGAAAHPRARDTIIMNVILSNARTGYLEETTL